MRSSGRNAFRTFGVLLVALVAAAGCDRSAEPAPPAESRIAETRSRPVSPPAPAKPGIARGYSIVEREDLSMKAMVKPLSAYSHAELVRLPTNVRKVYKIVVDSGISREDLAATMRQVVADETQRDPEIDEVAVFAYDSERDTSGGYTFGKLEWCPHGDWGSMTPEIASSNDRSSYDFTIDIKGKVGGSSGRPTEREFEIYRAFDAELWGNPEKPEEEVQATVSARFGVSVEEVNTIWVKVQTHQLH